MSSLANLFPPNRDCSQQECSSTTDQTQTVPLPCLPMPITTLERQVKYRNQDFGETTLKFRIGSDGVPRPVQPVCRTSEITFCQLLVAAGVLPESSILAAMEESCQQNVSLIRTIGRKFKFSRKTCLSICLLVEKLKAGTITFTECVLATQHMCVFRASLAEALQFVSSLAQQSIISFLQVVGLVSDDDLYRLTENHWIEPTRLAALLVAQGKVDIDVLRNATRLRYWLKTGVVDLEAATTLLIICMRESMDVEYCLPNKSVAA